MYENQNEPDFRRQKRLGSAPIASFEKSLDTEQPTNVAATIGQASSSAEAKPKAPLPHSILHIRSDETRARNNTDKQLETKSNKSKLQSESMTTVQKTVTISTLTPRIDISRASSSSQHEDSRESSPENVFEQVGTGTLQETSVALGFREEDTLELRSSTEELFFMDPEDKKRIEEEQKKIQQVTGKSPVIIKSEDYQVYLQQHQRKDSASSEVAALLCISGRTSRISSVGSQGSAVSRLSAISGISRSPSPHRMLLETSFCGPKPLDSTDFCNVHNLEQTTAEALEQALLARAKDPTKAILAEGIEILETVEPSKKEASRLKREEIQAALEKTLAIKPKNRGEKQKTAIKPNNLPNLRCDTASTVRPILGVTPSGTEYIRIKLKPDYLYEDAGLAPNEYVAADVATTSRGKESQIKPVTLSIQAARKYPDKGKLTPQSSPSKPSNIVRNMDSRSPSPATMALRKSSFCSLFKGKDSPDSPRDNKNGRSRSKSGERSQISDTPNKPKSVLAIFKPKRSGSRSKCSSPSCEQEETAAASQHQHVSQTTIVSHLKSEQAPETVRPPSRLRYYDKPSEGETSVYIPLHTPPEEKALKELQPNGIAQLSATPTGSAGIPKPPPMPPVSPTPHHTLAKSPKAQQIESLQRQMVQELEEKIAKKAQRQQKAALEELAAETKRAEKVEEIVCAEKHIEIQAVSPAAIRRELENRAQETRSVITRLPQNNSFRSEIAPLPSGKSTAHTEAEITINPSSSAAVTPHKPQAPTKERRKLLFATKIGSGSEEQIFSTQLSLSKTESLSSQLSEQMSIPESISETPASVEKTEILHRTDTVIRRPDDGSRNNETTSKGACGLESQSDVGNVVHMRKKESNECVTTHKKSVIKKLVDSNGSNVRNSRYIENFDPNDYADHTEESKKQPRSSCEKSSCSTIQDTKLEQSMEEDCDKEKDVQSQLSDGHLSNNNADDELPPIAGHLQQQKLAKRIMKKAEKSSSKSTDELVESSESERGAELDINRIKKHHDTIRSGTVQDHESTGLVSQESFDDDLPFVPTTLPEERALGISLIPMKERANMELKTIPVDRPRSTTPLNPASLEDYCEIAAGTFDDHDHVPVRGEKLRISLPRKDSKTAIVGTKPPEKSRSPRRTSNASSGKALFDFAEAHHRGQSLSSTTTTTTNVMAASNAGGAEACKEAEPPPALPARKQSTPSNDQWINFENIPEKRKQPKRITAVPKDSSQEYVSPTTGIQYNYVKPEDCQCECHHENEHDSGSATDDLKILVDIDLLQGGGGEDLQPLLDEAQEKTSPCDYDQLTAEERELGQLSPTQQNTAAVIGRKL